MIDKKDPLVEKVMKEIGSRFNDWVKKDDDGLQWFDAPKLQKALARMKELVIRKAERPKCVHCGRALAHDYDRCAICTNELEKDYIKKIAELQTNNEKLRLDNLRLKTKSANLFGQLGELSRELKRLRNKDKEDNSRERRLK